MNVLLKEERVMPKQSQCICMEQALYIILRFFNENTQLSTQKFNLKTDFTPSSSMKELY
jgi:hypothetical protein